MWPRLVEEEEKRLAVAAAEIRWPQNKLYVHSFLILTQWDNRLIFFIFTVH